MGEKFGCKPDWSFFVLRIETNIKLNDGFLFRGDTEVGTEPGSGFMFEMPIWICDLEELQQMFQTSRAPLCILMKVHRPKQTSPQQGPYVEEWKAFGPFRDFYEEDLEGGSTFLEDFDMKNLGFIIILESRTH